MATNKKPASKRKAPSTRTKPAARKTAPKPAAKRPAAKAKKTAPRKRATTRKATVASKPASTRRVAVPVVPPKPVRPRKSSRRFADHDAFYRWVALDMGKLLQKFLTLVPDDVRAKLDHSPRSLDVVEAWLVQRYPSPHVLALPDSYELWQGAAAYIGETLRKTLGGAWRVDLENRSDLYFDRPTIDGFPGCLVALCPELLTTMLLERRTGHELREILAANRPHIAQPPPPPPPSGRFRLLRR